MTHSLKLIDKVAGAPSSTAWILEVVEPILTAREILRRRVFEEVQRFNAHHGVGGGNAGSLTGTGRASGAGQAEPAAGLPRRPRSARLSNPTWSGDLHASDSCPDQFDMSIRLACLRYG